MTCSLDRSIPSMRWLARAPSGCACCCSGTAPSLRLRHRHRRHPHRPSPHRYRHRHHLQPLHHPHHACASSSFFSPPQTNKRTKQRHNETSNKQITIDKAIARSTPEPQRAYSIRNIFHRIQAYNALLSHSYCTPLVSLVAQRVSGSHSTRAAFSISIYRISLFTLSRTQHRRRRDTPSSRGR